MSRRDVISMIERIERIADMIPSSSRPEQEALAGQAMGTFYAAKSQLENSGISLKNDDIYNILDSLNPNNASEFSGGLHVVSGYLRALADQLPY